MTQSLWDEAANRFRATAQKAVTTGLGDRKAAPAPVKAPPPPAKGPASAGERVQMAEAGGPIVAGNAFLKDAVSRLGGDPKATRAFVIAVGTVATNKYNPADMRGSFLRDDAGKPDLAISLRGFDAGVAAAQALKSGATQQSTNTPNPNVAPPSDTIFGMPKLPVLAVGAVGIAGIVSYMLYPTKVKGLLGMAGDRSRGRRGHRYGRGRRY